MTKQLQKGLTAVEMVIVLAILGLLLFTAVPQWFKGDDRAWASSVEEFSRSLHSTSQRINAQAGVAPQQLGDILLQGTFAAPSGQGIGAALGGTDGEWVIFDSMGEDIVAWRPADVSVSRKWSLGEPERSSARGNRGCFAYYYLPADSPQPVIGTVITDC